MIAVVAIWAFAEALVWFVVADVPISALALRDGFPRAAAASLVAAVAAAAGGLAMLRWTATDPTGCAAVLERIPGIDAPMLRDTAAAWARNGFAAMLVGAFGGEPYKLYAHAAGLTGTAPAGFFLASIAARLPRFLIVSATAAALGPVLRRRLSRAQTAAAFLGFWTLFYAAYFLVINA